MKTRDGRLYIIGGASRSGKTAWTAAQVEAEPRVFAWDVEEQWAELRGWQKVTTRAGLLAAAKGSGPRRIAYVAGGDLQKEFDFFCGCAAYAGRYVEPCAVIAEELADVTTTGKAPGNWGILTRRGLKRGITIFAISQRWSEADKTAFGNASDYVVFRQSSAQDAKYLSSRVMVDAAEILALQPLEFIHRDAWALVTHPMQKMRFTSRPGKRNR